MKKILTLTLFPLLLFSCLHKKPSLFQTSEIVEEKASNEFVQGSDDIPLLVGMEKTSDESLGFDSSSGSITSSSYESKIDVEKVRNFYLKTLPQMGWQLAQNNSNKSTFKREKEKLEIEFSKQDGKNLVNFFISSAL